ncbi:MAG TPA: polysaccharide deacetylase family protein [Nitrospiraceae bacterium]|nr:polysaccharide deacetylase family protein [Nitrospiraceae bacterium]
MLLTASVLIGSVTAGSRDGTAQVIRSGSPTCKAIALTFDMCPVRDGAGYDAPLIDTLISKRIPATFFLSGRWIATHDAEVRALLSVPFFEIGTHGQLHAHLPMLDADRQRKEILGPVTLLQTRYGRRAPLFRPPYGEYNETSVEIARALGLRFILWNVVSGDPDPQLSRTRIVDNLKATVRNGSIIVFHANGRGRHTRAVVEDLYQDLVLTKNLQPVTVSTLLDGCEAGRTRDGTDSSH